MEELKGPGVAGASAAELDLDPEFQAEYLKAQFTEMVFTAMKQQRLGVGKLAKLIGTTRQNLHQMLRDENNYTFESATRLTAALGQQLYITIDKPGAHLVCWRDYPNPTFRTSVQTENPVGSYKETSETLPIAFVQLPEVSNG